jgi:hypothetical protein
LRNKKAAWEWQLEEFNFIKTRCFGILGRKRTTIKITAIIIKAQ